MVLRWLQDKATEDSEHDNTVSNEDDENKTDKSVSIPVNHETKRCRNIQFIKRFLFFSFLPKVELHYCRVTSKMYLLSLIHI